MNKYVKPKQYYVFKDYDHLVTTSFGVAWLPLEIVEELKKNNGKIMLEKSYPTRWECVYGDES
jgi:hypothetical protein